MHSETTDDTVTDMKLSNFPVLIPAFTARVSHTRHPLPHSPPSHSRLTTQIFIDRPLTISEDLLNIPFLPNAGSLVSEPSYPFPLTATFIQGSDYLRRDQDGQHVRLEVASIARSEDTGALVRFGYTGVVGLLGDEGRVIRGDCNATTTGFGNACELAPFFLNLLLSHPVLRIVDPSISTKPLKLIRPFQPRP